jgi:NifU-like protein involved in Fe-S cluster formation
MNGVTYHPQVVELFRRLPFAGSMDPAVGVFTGAAGGQGYGAEVRFWLKCAGNRIQAISFQAFGCPHTIAAAAWVAQRARGLTLEKRGRLLIVEDALLTASKSAAGNV